MTRLGCWQLRAGRVCRVGEFGGHALVVGVVGVIGAVEGCTLVVCLELCSGVGNQDFLVKCLLLWLLQLKKQAVLLGILLTHLLENT